MKKHLFIKKLLVLLVVLITCISTAWGQTYRPAKVDNQKHARGVAMQGAAIQSQQIMTGGAYKGTVYEPFSNATPSEANGPAKAPGRRRGYNQETGEWTPDAPDIETAGDYGQSGESPIGEPWVLAIFALAFAGVIAIRQYKRKTVKSMNMKNSTSKFIATLALLCTLGVGQMWGYNQQFDGKTYIYWYTSPNAYSTWSTDANIYIQLKKNYDPWSWTGWKSPDDVNDGWARYLVPADDYCNVQLKTERDGGKYTSDGGNISSDKTVIWNYGSGWVDYEWHTTYFARSAYVYFDNSNGVLNQSVHQILLGRGGWPDNASKVYKLKNFSNTSLWYYDGSITYNNYQNFYFISNSSEWSGYESSSASSRVSSATRKTADCAKMMDHSSRQYNLFVPSSSSDGTSVTSYGYSGYSSLNSDQRVHTVVGIPGGTYSPADAKAEISMTSYALTGETTCSEQNQTLSTSESSKTISACRTATTTFTTASATGYTFSGWYTAANGGSQLQASTTYTYYPTAETDVYARWTANTHTVTLDQESGVAGYNTPGTVTEKTATYNEDMPTVGGTMPIAATGYKFAGYYTGHNGTGTKYYNADGTSAHKWDIDENTTLYAYFEKAQITNISFSPTTAAGETKVVATPTVSPSPEGTTYICWKLFNNAECTHETEGYTFSNAAGDAILNPSGNSNAVSFVTPAFTGSYYVQAILRAGNDCEESTKLDSVVYQYLVASDHTVKVKYMCDGVEIAPLTEVVIPAAGYKGIKALSGNDVFGYQFSSWSLGDGLSNECADPSNCGAAGKDSIYISAVYNGTLTANYTKKNIIFFKDNLGWTDPDDADAHMYVHLKSASEWNSSRGVGNMYNYYSRNNQMNRVPGTSNIFYYEYGAGSISKYIAFTKYSYDNYESFSGSVADPAQVVYVTNPTPASSDMSANYGFDASTPMFVPLDKTTYAGQLWNESQALYFNRGYWVNYIGEETGYYLDLYDGSTLIKSVKFTSEDKLMSMSVTLDLEAAKDYYFKLRRGSSITYGNAGYMKSGESGTDIGWEFDPAVDNKCEIRTTAAGDYTFLLSYSANKAGTHALRIGVTYPSSDGDYRLVYKDLATWSQGSAHTASWNHPSRVITQRASAEDMVSFYISKAEGANASLTLQQVSTIDPSTGAITWTAGTDISSLLSSITESGVYNFKVTQDENKAVSVTYEGAYEGNYYIRTDNAGSSKWSDYIALDHQMTYSEYAISSGYTHYYMHYCTRGSNVKFCIANDYSPCISDTLIQDVTRNFDQNMDENGFLSNDGHGDPDYDRYSANIRFMWNQNTNKISRAYLSSSLSGNLLTLTNNGANVGDVTDENDVNKSGVNITFKDDQNWIYEAIVKVKPSANVRLKVFARYSNAGNTATKDQYLIGSYNSGTYDASSSELLLTGTGDIMQTIRILYDFKTNRLVKAWMPTAEIEGAQTIDADLMIVREHQQSAQNILLVDKDKVHGSLTTDKKIYAVMRFNRWILSNRANPNDKSDTHAGDDYYTYHPLLPVGQWLPTYERSLYYISFPFDVKISEIFGFGNYGTHYAIQRYDGAGRAKNGYWVDSDPNWKWVPPTGTLNAYEGYVLSLSMSNMDAGNTAVWTNKSSEIELYFPSSTTGTITIETTNVTIDALDDKIYKCKIERDKRNIKDSYWRCIGVPSYADYSGTLTDDKAAVINWQKEKEELPFIYEINWQDKSLTPFVGTNFPFKAMHSYLVQYGGEINWTNVANVSSSIVARERTTTTEQVYRLELSQSDAFCDQTYVRMTDIEGVTNSFDFNHDLSKETNAGRANIWTMTADSVSAAGNSMPTSNQTSVIPVGVKIIDDGDYTISMPEGTNGVGVVLIDNIAGTRTNLALEDYTINLAAGQYDERFILEISPIVNTPTGVETVSGDGKKNIRKMMVDGVLYIVRDGKVFDARGMLCK